MTPSVACENLVKASESCKLVEYKDPAGIPTIGWGHKMVNGDPPSPWTQLQANLALEKDLQTACNEMLALVKVPLTQGQCDALTDFVFNMGSGRLAGSMLLKLLNMGQYDRAKEELGKWVYGGGKVLLGLVTRRKAEQELWG